jgi:periplasmic protein TonB
MTPSTARCSDAAPTGPGQPAAGPSVRVVWGRPPGRRTACSRAGATLAALALATTLAAAPGAAQAQTAQPAAPIAAPAAPATPRAVTPPPAAGASATAPRPARPAPPPRRPAAAAPQSQFTMVPSPMLDEPPAESAAENEREYRVDAARHLYAAYPMRVFKGQLPPLLYSVMMVETEISREGEVLDIAIIRKPAADEVAPWVLAMIRRAGPFPPPSKIDTATVRFTEAWFVDRSGLFQLMSLTEGQR